MNNRLIQTQMILYPQNAHSKIFIRSFGHLSHFLSFRPRKKIIAGNLQSISKQAQRLRLGCLSPRS